MRCSCSDVYFNLFVNSRQGCSFMIFAPLSHCVVLICNTERLRRGLGGCSEIGFALLQHLSAHFNLPWPCPTECGCCPPQLWPSSVWPISAVFGRCAKVTFRLHPRAAENGRNRPRLAIRAVTIFRGRALSQSATVNRAHMAPRHLATSETPQTRDRGLKTLGVVRYETPRIEHVRSRVSTSLIGA